MYVSHNFGSHHGDAMRYAWHMIQGGWRVQVRRFDGEWHVIILGFSR